MELASFVRVVVRLADGATGVGTGYRLREDRVLTAGHVVEGAVEIEVEVDGADGRPSAAAANVLWQGKGGLDAAVLDCRPRAPAPAALTHLAEAPLGRTARWESRGLARAAVEGGSVGDSMAALGGRAYAVAEHEERLELEVEAPPREVDDWSGISGAPVFVGGRIHGVIREAPTSFEGRRLHATPVHRLLAQEDFAAAVGLERASKWEELLAEVRHLLGGDREAAEAIARRRPAWNDAFGDSTEALAAAIGGSDVGEVLLELHEAHRALGGRPAARTVERILARLVPVLYDRQLVYSLPGEPGGVVLEVPVATATVAEMVMAGVDGRAFRYRPQEDLAAFPQPLASVAGFPEPGIDPSGARALKDFVDHLAAVFVAAEDRQRLTQEGRPEERRYDDLARLVDDELEWRAEHGAERLRRYFLFDGRFARDHGPFLGLLRRSLPSLRLVELTGDDLPGERRLCRPLRELLYRSHSHGRTEK